MSTHTEIYALFGNPVGHSLSPVMHNCAFREMKRNALYVPFCVNEVGGAAHSIRALGIRGVSVTIPFKTAVMTHLDDIEEDARKIGAVNTISNKEGRLTGHNTDWIGLVRSLEEVNVTGKTFAVLGAGGAARAAVFGILKKGGIPVIVNRTVEKGESLAREFGCSFVPIGEIAKLDADCLINTTPVGMAPDEDKMPLRHGDVARFRWVMDIIYNPLWTTLLREASGRGCSVLNGMDMFVHQGAEQIRIWTGQEPPVALMRQVVLKQFEAEKMGR